MLRYWAVALLLLVPARFAQAAGEVWAEPSWVNVAMDAQPGKSAKDAVRLYAARGEAESVQICIQGGRGGYRVESVEAPALDDDIAAPEYYRVGYLAVEGPSSRAVEAGAQWPDPLLPFAPFELQPKETRALWFTYRVSETAKAGLHKGAISILPQKGPAKKIPVVIEVFDFDLPQVPSLAVYFPLDRKPIRSVYRIPDTVLEPWKPVYDALGKERISFGLWTDGNLVKVGPDGSADATALKEHLDYVVDATRPAAINVGKGNEGVAPFPAPPEGAIQDPLQLYLHDVGNWLGERGWLERAFTQPMPPQERADWQEARNAYFRVSRADKRIPRLLAGALHPMLERYTDIWAVPLRYYHPFAQRRLQEGFSLRAEPAHPVVQFDASSSGGAGTQSFVDTHPSEACDGSLFTAWISGEVPSERDPQWIRFDLAEPVRTSRIRVAWRPGLEPEEIRVRTAMDGRTFNDADTRWEHHFAVDPLDDSWSEGKFRNLKPFQSLVLEFSESKFDSPIAVSEIEFGDPPRQETVERIAPLRIWTYTIPGDFPSFNVDAHPWETRLIGWMCWGHKASGFLYDRLTQWPRGWEAQTAEAPWTWSGGGWGEGFLFYPGPNGLMPSVRAERLRDGIEDYEYLSRLDAAVKAGLIADPKLSQWTGRRFFGADVPAEGLATLANRLPAARVEIGRALDKLGERVAKE
ncbi:MAG: DUF4091 domain-containing protein [FCB group bacterium]|jgi:hypothetical protein|nr:DUF4091 domain-containing protein [FCB group bacterium]